MLYSNIVGPYEVERVCRRPPPSLSPHDSIRIYRKFRTLLPTFSPAQVRGKKKYAMTTNVEYSKKRGKEIEYKFLGLNQVQPAGPASLSLCLWLWLRVGPSHSLCLSFFSPPALSLALSPSLAFALARSFSLALSPLARSLARSHARSPGRHQVKPT